ncbi:MAG: UDP-N-acetylmuramoyl-L-alanine--D-glutamate ligase [Myxococcales bacterium]|nr:UDP-N-acetylmuramoyl-L-alanine--D-glutamate ligase [Myxococcales bacterium]
MTGLAGRRVAVWGAGVSGVAAASLLVELGAEAILSDARPLDALQIEGLDARVAVHGGGNVLAGADLLVPSPGIPPRALRGVGVPLMSEIELAASVARGPIVAISGTDGKSTTTEMIGAVVRAAGRRAEVCGNIGVPFSARVLAAAPDDVLVVETSAFQLWSCGRFRPQVAVITNVAGDHLDYFDEDAAAYARAKARVLPDQQPGDAAILRAEDPVVSGFETAAGVRRVLFGPSPRAAGLGLADGVITLDGAALLPAAALPLPGAHNIANAQAALAAGLALGLDAAPMVAALQRFRGLPHRLQLVGERADVRWYDDSKATNPHASAVGLAALPGPLVVITGGYDKGLDLQPFLDAVIGRARHVIVMGPTGARTAAALAGAVPTTAAADLPAAVALAAALASPGDQVVLSPAASSFDAWTSYAARGDAFQACVRQQILTP